VKAWDRGPRPSRGGHPDASALGDLERRGIDLDPESSGAAHRGAAAADHAHPSEHAAEHPGEHAHPHVHAEAGETPVVGIVGAGAVGTALGVALEQAGWPVAAIASRDPGRRERFRALVPRARGFAEATALLDEVELIILAVPDDALPGLATELRMYSGQAMVHTSGALGAEVLEPARAAGTQIGAFHPLVAFADTDRAVAALHGATIAVEGDDQLADLLARMADALGATAVRLAPGSKAAYHAAAMLSAGGVVALLDAIAELGAVAGLDEAGALAIYGGLVEQTLGNARALGIARALTGPMVRGDVGTIERHLEALARDAPDVLPLYRAIAEREVAIAERRGALSPEVVASIRNAVARRDRLATM
jgi:predicted short-subunit dehydrogenase-like oxidoreductase (DUF2520 family)